MPPTSGTRLENVFQRLPVSAVANQHTLTFFDIGSRGGFETDLNPLGFAVDAVGFEPDPDAFKTAKERSSAIWKTATMLPHAVGALPGKQTLHIPTDPQSASLLKHDTSYGEKFQKPQFFEVQRHEEIDVLGLEDALNKSPVDRIDYLKIDIEGPELQVLQSAPDLTRDMLGIRTEISFVPFRHGQSLAHEVHAYLADAGFELMDIIAPARWRRHGDLIDPYYATGVPAYSKGQIIQADYLFFRNPDHLASDPEALVRLALVNMALGYFDHALMILERPDITRRLKEAFDLSPLQIIAPASKAYGRMAFTSALYQQVRGFVPFLRYLKNLWR